MRVKHTFKRDRSLVFQNIDIENLQKLRKIDVFLVSAVRHQVELELLKKFSKHTPGIARIDLPDVHQPFKIKHLQMVDQQVKIRGDHLNGVLLNVETLQGKHCLNLWTDYDDMVERNIQHVNLLAILETIGYFDQ